MPTYEYACKSCDEHVEVVQSFKDGPLTECPKCGGPLRKVFGSIGISFKGSGFYKNDTRKTPKSDAASSSSSDKGGSSDKSATADKTPKSDKSDKPAPAAKSSSAEPGSGRRAAAS